MWKFTCPLFGKSPYSSLNPNPVITFALHTSRNPNWNPPPSSHLLNLSRSEVKEILAVKCKTGFDRVDDAHDLFHTMLQFQPLPFIADFNRLLNGVVKMKQFSSAVLIYREMHFQGVPIDIWTENIVINSLCHLNQVDFGFAILASIIKLGFKPDVVTLTTLIRGLFKADRIAEAVELFRIMVIQKLCNETSYGTVINGLCKSGNTFKAIQLLRLVEKEGYHQPDTVMYNAIIDSLCKDRKLDEALQLLSEMAANGIPSDVFTYSSLIQGLCNFGRWKEVGSLLTEMAKMRIFPNVFTFNILVDAFSKEGLVEEAEDMLKIMIKMRECGCLPDDFTYNPIVQCLLKESQGYGAKLIFEEMLNHGITPDSYTCSLLANSALLRKNI